CDWKCRGRNTVNSIKQVILSSSGLFPVKHRSINIKLEKKTGCKVNINIRSHRKLAVFSLCRVTNIQINRLENIDFMCIAKVNIVTNNTLLSAVKGQIKNTFRPITSVHLIKPIDIRI